MCTEHYEIIDKLYELIVNACVEAGVLTIPQSKIVYKNGRGRHIAGWNEYVEPLRNRSLMWHQIWKGQGSPKEGYIARL